MWPAAYDILPTIARPSKAIPQVQPDIRSPINGYVRGPRDPHHRGHPRDPELPWVPANLKFGWPASARGERESSRGWACIRTPPPHRRGTPRWPYARMWDGRVHGFTRACPVRAVTREPRMCPFPGGLTSGGGVHDGF